MVIKNLYHCFVTISCLFKINFIHVFGHIMQGRNTEQKADLSRKIVTRLKSMFPDVPVISMNVIDFEKATYCNKTMV